MDREELKTAIAAIEHAQGAWEKDDPPRFTREDDRCLDKLVEHLKEKLNGPVDI